MYRRSASTRWDGARHASSPPPTVGLVGFFATTTTTTTTTKGRWFRTHRLSCALPTTACRWCLPYRLLRCLLFVDDESKPCRPRLRRHVVRSAGPLLVELIPLFVRTSVSMRSCVCRHVFLLLLKAAYHAIRRCRRSTSVRQSVAVALAVRSGGVGST